VADAFEDLKDGDLIASFGDDNPILNKPAKKRRWTVRPYVKFRDFNRQGADEFEDNPPETGVEVGLKFTF